MSNGKSKENLSLLLYKKCDELKKEFYLLKTRRNIANLLEIPYDRLVYHLYKVSEEEKYKEFPLSKRSGGTRIISAPSSALKIIQRKLSQVLYSVYEPKASVQGFVMNRSIVTNAEKHLRKRFVLNIDIEDFFGSIHFGRVRGIFIASPYQRSEEVSTTLAQICCLSQEISPGTRASKLPQGAPTSPIISNMICARLDSQLRLLAKEFKCTYTRYADDITFSTTLPKFPREVADECTEGDELKVSLGERLVSIIQDNGFKVNENKIRLQHKSHHQEVTGLTVNQFPNVKRDYVRKISSMLHVWNKFGLESAEQRYIQKRSEELGIPKEEVPPFQEVLRGKINFLGMVRGKDDKIYRKYSAWYYNLLKS
jgi:RNA-directed DNA polymerase